MILEAALALSLLTADPALPANHPPVGSGGAPGAAMPANHPQVAPGKMAPPLDENGNLVMPPNHPGGAGQMQPPIPQGPSNEELLKQAEASGHLKDRDKPFEAAYGLGKLYYLNARYAEAAEFLRQALEKSEPVRALVLEERKKVGAKPLPNPTDVGCTVDKDFKIDAMLAKAREKAKAGEAAAALVCAQTASISAQEASELRARALFIEGDRRGALTEYDRLLELSPERGTALYGRALTRVDWDGDDVGALKKSKADLDRVATVWKAQAPPELAKWQGLVNAMIDAGGMTKLAQKRAEERKAHPVDTTRASASPHVAMGGQMSGAAGAGSSDGPPQLTQEMVDAVQNTERTPELEAGMARLVEQGEAALAKGQFQDALDLYKRVVPFQPENGRAKAGMAWALVGLGKPMADRIWSVAVSSDPAAVDGLGKTLSEKGDQKGAKALWAKLASSDPAYAAKSNLAARVQ